MCFCGGQGLWAFGINWRPVARGGFLSRCLAPPIFLTSSAETQDGKGLKVTMWSSPRPPLISPGSRSPSIAQPLHTDTGDARSPSQACVQGLWAANRRRARGSWGQGAVDSMFPWENLNVLLSLLMGSMTPCSDRTGTSRRGVRGRSVSPALWKPALAPPLLLTQTRSGCWGV